LNEQKAAIINDVVTGKINCLNQDLQDEKMSRIRKEKSRKSLNQENPDSDRITKPSGIEWLGDIPEHWEVRKLKYVAKIKTGRTPKIENSQIDYFENGEVNWFTPGDFNNEGVLLNSKRSVIQKRI
jgi:type I restriction enzyme S subunit